MDTSRRHFIGRVSAGVAGTLASMTPGGALLASGSTLRLGVIGGGSRGQELMRQAIACPGTEVAVVADVYGRRREECRNIAPAAGILSDYRELLADRSIDAVLIATPQHLHAEHLAAALEAGKHAYQESIMAFHVDHAKRIRAALRRSGKVVQVGHQVCSSGHMADVQAILAEGLVGRITEIHACLYRNTPHGRPQWARPVYPDVTRENVDWDLFLGEAPETPFDAQRFINWRFFFDYSGGAVFENMAHQLAFWYQALDLKIPVAATMRGGIYRWQDGREVPDTMNVTLEQPEGLLFTWSCGFSNDYLGSSEEVLGTDGTISKSRQVRYLPQKVNRPQAREYVGSAQGVSHLQNFLDSVRSGAQPNCPFETGYRTSIACRMAVESYLQGRTVQWDERREIIV